MIALWRLVQINDYKKLHGLLKIRKQIQRNNIRGLKVDNMNPKEITEKSENKLRLRDELSKNYTLIYKSTIKNYIYLSFHGSYIICIVSLYGLYHAIVNSEKFDFLKPDVPCDSKTPHITLFDQFEAIISYAVLLLMNGFLFIFCRRHILRIWRHTKDNECVMILPTFLPNSCRKIVFKPGFVKQKYPTAKNDITRAPHLINGKTYHINDYNFRTPADYNKVIFG